jgi:hypothetical protein
MICIAHNKNTWDKNINRKLARAGQISRNSFQRLDWFDTCNKELFDWRKTYRSLNKYEEIQIKPQAKTWAEALINKIIR